MKQMKADNPQKNSKEHFVKGNYRLFCSKEYTEIQMGLRGCT